jgi:hypothetical protein
VKERSGLLCVNSIFVLWTLVFRQKESSSKKYEVLKKWRRPHSLTPKTIKAVNNGAFWNNRWQFSNMKRNKISFGTYVIFSKSRVKPLFW